MFKLLKKDEIKKYRKLGAKIGDNCKLYSVFIDYGHAYLAEIGDNCILTHCCILTHDASTRIAVKKSKVGKVKIGNNSFIGYGSIILPNVTIGNNCIIGAGAVVGKNIPDNSIVCGNPAKIISTMDDFKQKHITNLKEKPVFNVRWQDKTISDKNKEREALNNTYGYDE